MLYQSQPPLDYRPKSKLNFGSKPINKKTVYLNTAHWAADTGRSYTEHEERIKYYKDSNHMINSSHGGKFEEVARESKEGMMSYNDK